MQLNEYPLETGRLRKNRKLRTGSLRSRRHYPTSDRENTGSEETRCRPVTANVAVPLSVYRVGRTSQRANPFPERTSPPSVPCGALHGPLTRSCARALFEVHARAHCVPRWPCGVRRPLSPARSAPRAANANTCHKSIETGPSSLSTTNPWRLSIRPHHPGMPRIVVPGVMRVRFG